MARPKVDTFIDKFDAFTQKPVNYLTVQDDLKENIKNLVKSLYDYTKLEEGKYRGKKQGALKRLMIQDFDEEQIWQQIELQNGECCEKLTWEVADVVSNKDDLTFPVTVHRESEEEIIDNVSEDETMDQETSENDINVKILQLDKPKKVKKNKVKQSVVDDDFFKLRDMEHFLINEEKRDGSKTKKGILEDSDEESIDLFEDIDDRDLDEEEGGKDMMYSDFFDGDNEKEDDENMESDENDSLETNKNIAVNGINNDDDDEDVDDEGNDDENDDDEISNDNEIGDNGDKMEDEKINNLVNGKSNNERKSEFEQRQDRLQQTISRLEGKVLKEAPWQLKGEVDASKRPLNSLLEEVVDFDLTSRPAPIITEQTTVTLEDIIMRRIKDKAWDDVVKKEKPVDDQLSFRKNEVLDQSKSKLSLAQVYEAEYLKQKQAASGEVVEEQEPESHTEIKDAMTKLFSKLDALCHYHYTPKLPQVEVKIVSNTPAITMEEVAPVATSDAALLAPEEIKKKQRGEFMSKEERSQTDKNRERRKKKKLQRQKGTVKKVTEHRNTKKGVEANDKALKTSKAFFQQLNDNSTGLIKNSHAIKSKKNKGQ
ncbi:U3 small nucleolar ribonucleoprotein protein MPP10-like [Achroia grisella]|uniref:U3 small nucleolar ribonucleoprotein protein MPP10-like n=1 Tax=Achroia grisella TaxID=688607 RepID=UPI0027D2FC25|nr:U3 small nucleolar ribonucleoprotein protein MPP10-like [Achroia grisella]